LHVPIKGVQRRSKRSGILFGKRFLIKVQNAEEGKKAGNSSRNTSGCTMHMQRPLPSPPPPNFQNRYHATTLSKSIEN
jgi:hypothetical protein